MKETLFFPWHGVTALLSNSAGLACSGLLCLTLKLLKQQWVRKVQSPYTTFIFKFIL